MGRDHQDMGGKFLNWSKKKSARFLAKNDDKLLNTPKVVQFHLPWIPDVQREAVGHSADRAVRLWYARAKTVGWNHLVGIVFTENGTHRLQHLLVLVGLPHAHASAFYQKSEV